jgi:beta-fructofuranosidase
MRPEEGGYLQADEEFSLQATKTICGEEISMIMRLSLARKNRRITVTFGDNDLILSGGSDDWDETQLILQGPSVGKRVVLGRISDYIEPDVPFELAASYRNNMLVYAIDGRELYCENTDIAPAGFISMRDFGGNVRVYDLVAEGKFSPPGELYTRDFLLERAHKSVKKAAAKVRNDPNRPAFHFLPPANWNNDPNGLLFHDGTYHLFYQHNPYADHWNWMHWGHARSRDMVHWEHMPIALWPSLERGEKHCFSGSGYITDAGEPILFYTSIGHETPEHWAAVPADNELAKWNKHPANPIIVMDDHGGQHIDDWRDPFLFRETGQTYMVIGGHPRGVTGSIMLYKASNSELTKWEYLGVPFSGEERNWECPNFFKIGEHYVLIYSPHGRVEYFTGTMDFERNRFTPKSHGFIDNGGRGNYYAPNTLQMEDGERILFGWIPGFREDEGWQGAISLPRELSIDGKGRLIQKPVPQLTALRGEHRSEKRVVLTDTAKKIEISKPQFELLLKIGGQGADRIGFRFNDRNGDPFEIVLEPEVFRFNEKKVTVDPEIDHNLKSVHLFFDRTVIEIYVNSGELCATKVVYPDRINLDFEIFDERDELDIESLDVWEMASIW